MLLSVVILNWNGIKLLKEFLPSVVEHSKGFPIYIIDNASTDDSIEYISKNYPGINIIQNHENFGFTKGYNEGLKFIDSKYYCLLNSDVKVTKNWIDPILELLEKNEQIAAVQPKILSYNNPEYFEFAGAGGGFIDALGYPFCRGRVFYELEKDNRQYNDTKEIFWATGACFFVRKEDFFKQKGFDEDYFAHMEEIDLCWRFINQGKKIYYCGYSTVYHLGGGTLNKYSPKKTFLNFRNNLLMLLKNLPAYQWFFIIFIRLFLDGIAAIKFLFTDGFFHLFAVLKAHFSFYFLFFKFYKKRKAGVQRYYQTKSILYNFYLKKFF